MTELLQTSVDYYLTHKTERLNYQQQYNAEHRTEIKEYQHTYYVENRAEKNEKQKLYNKEHRAEIREKSRQRYNESIKMDKLECACGSVVIRKSIKAHEKTAKHRTWVDEQKRE
jgi:hypothetical protein